MKNIDIAINIDKENWINTELRHLKGPKKGPKLLSEIIDMRQLKKGPKILSEIIEMRQLKKAPTLALSHPPENAYCGYS